MSFPLILNVRISGEIFPSLQALTDFLNQINLESISLDQTLELEELFKSQKSAIELIEREIGISISMNSINVQSDQVQVRDTLHHWLDYGQPVEVKELPLGVVLNVLDLFRSSV
jgi:hypothetical protein